VGASYNWHELVLFCLDKGWYGLENLSLIPGTIGAAPVQNIGAYGREISEFVISVSGFDMNTGKYHVFTHSECQFSYRSSYFKTHLKSSFLITSVRLQLYKNPLIKADYPDVQKALLDAHIKNPTPKEISEIIIHIRQSKLPDPLQIGNAGSFFKNPSITEEYYHSLIKRYPGIPSYPQTDGTVKISAAWLIDSCGWKGFREHDIGVHNKQALVLVNYGNGKARDIYHLSMKIQESIKNMYGIFLEPEVNIIL
jgi:UDP-N-acetylmuramate dehydrogenase